MRIAVVDSGIAAGHPHVGPVAGGVSFAGAGDWTDRLGHGTAVAGAIRQWAPDAELYAVKVFDGRLSATIDTLALALEWCREHAMDIVNLSLGTANAAHRDRLRAVVAAAPLVVSPADLLPGSFPDVAGVEADPECPRDSFRFSDGKFHASPYPRPIPGVPVEYNLNGVSFAVANLTGLAAASGWKTREALAERAASGGGGRFCSWRQARHRWAPRPRPARTRLPMSRCGSRQFRRNSLPADLCGHSHTTARFPVRCCGCGRDGPSASR